MTFYEKFSELIVNLKSKFHLEIILSLVQRKKVLSKEFFFHKVIVTKNEKFLVVTKIINIIINDIHVLFRMVLCYVNFTIYLIYQK